MTEGRLSQQKGRKKTFTIAQRMERFMVERQDAEKRFFYSYCLPCIILYLITLEWYFVSVSTSIMILAACGIVVFLSIVHLKASCKSRKTVQISWQVGA